jgi:hypothetical protein
LIANNRFGGMQRKVSATPGRGWQIRQYRRERRGATSVRMTYDPYDRYPACVDALMFAGDLRSPINCVIRNVSEGGALLALDRPVQLPKRIYLTLSKGAQVLECEVRWRSSNRLFGVRFSPNNSPEARRALVETCAFSRPAPRVKGGAGSRAS